MIPFIIILNTISSILFIRLKPFFKLYETPFHILANPLQGSGEGIPKGKCDCNGNELDCSGVCGGPLKNDECGVCNGPGVVEPFCDCKYNTWGCDHVCSDSPDYVDECGVCNGQGIPDGYCSCDKQTVDECGVCGGPGI